MVPIKSTDVVLKDVIIKVSGDVTERKSNPPVVKFHSGDKPKVDVRNPDTNIKTLVTNLIDSKNCLLY